MDTREKIARRITILRTVQARGRIATDLAMFRRGVRRELGELLGKLERAQNTASCWLTLAQAMRREGWTREARKALEYARSARLTALEVARITANPTPWRNR
jgi:hypothetical protein